MGCVDLTNFSAQVTLLHKIAWFAQNEVVFAWFFPISRLELFVHMFIGHLRLNPANLKRASVKFVQ